MKELSEKQINILSKAEELIAKKGFEGASIRDISTAAEVNVAMISYYFGSKDKMMIYLYRYRLQKSRLHFIEFSETIKNGKPAMQMKEIIKFIISQIYLNSHFHGFIAKDNQKLDFLNDELSLFYQTCVNKIDELIKKGISTGVFTFASKAEDVLGIIVGVPLFTIRNQFFYNQFIPNTAKGNYTIESEKKARTNVLMSVFALLGYINQ